MWLAIAAGVLVVLALLALAQHLTLRHKGKVCNFLDELRFSGVGSACNCPWSLTMSLCLPRVFPARLQCCLSLEISFQ